MVKEKKKKKAWIARNHQWFTVIMPALRRLKQEDYPPNCSQSGLHPWVLGWLALDVPSVDNRSPKRHLVVGSQGTHYYQVSLEKVLNAYIKQHIECCNRVAVTALPTYSSSNSSSWSAIDFEIPPSPIKDVDLSQGPSGTQRFAYLVESFECPQKPKLFLKINF